MWAGHQTHHSSEDYNLSTALRQSAVHRYIGWVKNKQTNKQANKQKHKFVLAVYFKVILCVLEQHIDHEDIHYQGGTATFGLNNVFNESVPAHNNRIVLGASNR